jgi:hypothetical protein
MRQVAVPVSLLVLASGQSGLVSSAQCDEHDLDRHRRHRLVAAGRASRATQGVLDVAGLVDAAGLTLPRGPDHVRRRAAHSALLAFGPGAVAVGQCALALLGIQGLPSTIRPEVGLPGGSARRARDGIVVRRFRVATPTVRRGGFRVMAPTQALAQSVRELRRDCGVAVLDSAVQQRLIRADELDAVLDAARDRVGAARVRTALALVDGRAQSPLETFARLQCVDAGLPPDDLQVPVRDATGRIVARGDLGWRLRRGRWLLVEIDGAGPHSTPEALFADRARQNAVVATGRADVLRFTARDLAERGLLPAAVTAHRHRDDLNFRLDQAARNGAGRSSTCDQGAIRR